MSGDIYLVDRRAGLHATPTFKRSVFADNQQLQRCLVFRPALPSLYASLEPTSGRRNRMFDVLICSGSVSARHPRRGACDGSRLGAVARRRAHRVASACHGRRCNGISQFRDRKMHDAGATCRSAASSRHARSAHCSPHAPRRSSASCQAAIAAASTPRGSPSSRARTFRSSGSAEIRRSGEEGACRRGHDRNPQFFWVGQSHHGHPSREYPGAGGYFATRGRSGDRPSRRRRTARFGPDHLLNGTSGATASAMLRQ